jgi:hypothetical protein
MDTLISTFTKHNKGKNVVDCKVIGEYAQKMFCSSVGQSFSNFWKGCSGRVFKPEICVSARCGPYLSNYPSLYFHRLKSVTVILTDES